MYSSSEIRAQLQSISGNTRGLNCSFGQILIEEISGRDLNAALLPELGGGMEKLDCVVHRAIEPVRNGLLIKHW